MMLAALAGTLCGIAILFTMRQAGLLKERSGLAVLVAAIAAFYPVFAVQAGAGGVVIGLHVAIFFAFSGLALLGFHRGGSILALALIAHGLFDLIAGATGHPGPDWWPAFCATLDVVVGAGLLYLIRQGEIA